MRSIGRANAGSIFALGVLTGDRSLVRETTRRSWTDAEISAERQRIFGLRAPARNFRGIYSADRESLGPDSFGKRFVIVAEERAWPLAAVIGWQDKRWFVSGLEIDDSLTSKEVAGLVDREVASGARETSPPSGKQGLLGRVRSWLSKLLRSSRRSSDPPRRDADPLLLETRRAAEATGGLLARRVGERGRAQTVRIVGYLVDWSAPPGQATGSVPYLQLVVMKDGATYFAGEGMTRGAFRLVPRRRRQPEPPLERAERTNAVTKAHREVVRRERDLREAQPLVYSYLIRIERPDGSYADVWADPDVGSDGAAKAPFYFATPAQPWPPVW